VTTSESKGRFFYKTNRFEWSRIANWNALVSSCIDGGVVSSLTSVVRIWAYIEEWNVIGDATCRTTYCAHLSAYLHTPSRASPIWSLLSLLIASASGQVIGRQFSTVFYLIQPEEHIHDDSSKRGSVLRCISSNRRWMKSTCFFAFE